jgi:glycosyltransferase involved in cell wall biosynthesis
MSAGRAVIGSNRGGMNGILNNGAGILVNPHNIADIEEAIINLLDNETLRWKLGESARLKVSSVFNTSIIGMQMEAQYQRTIESVAKRLVQNG